MGFLDHSTNNIIIDAVLTNLGREILANNSAQFRIEKFSLADDEVDYGLIKKFGRTVGKEKIIKNTPIFEAQTDPTLSQKYRLLSIADASSIYLPVFEISQIGTNNDQVSGVSKSANSGTVTLTLGGQTALTSVTVKQKMDSSQSVPAVLSEVVFDIYMNDNFLKINGAGSWSHKDLTTSIARWTLTTTQTTENNGTYEGTFTLEPRNLDLTKDFELYGDPSSQNKNITTIVSVVGRNSGARADITVTLKKP